MRLRNPRYTGANRCWPCTVTNGALLGAGAIALAGFADPALGAAVLAVGLVVVALRGYLIPGTPALTRKLPASILAAFGKDDSNPAESAPDLSELPAGEALVAADLLTADGALAPAVETRLRETAAEHLDDRDALEATIVETFDEVVETSARRQLGGGENWFAFDADEVTVHQWNHRAVAALDVAATALLAERLPDWDRRSPTDRKTARALLRYGLRACPACGDEYVEPDGSRVACCGGRSLVGERRCATCDYALVDRNDLPTDAEATA